MSGHVAGCETNKVDWIQGYRVSQNKRKCVKVHWGCLMMILYLCGTFRKSKSRVYLQTGFGVSAELWTSISTSFSSGSLAQLRN